MKNWCRKYFTNVILVGLVAAVGGVAAYLYIDQFGSNGFSNKSEDWANFATYISGTVGVAAVVATLIAFVITLRQQQALIDSQDLMLKEQRKQISMSESQIEIEKKRREIDLAYDNVKYILPMMLEYVELSLKEFVMPSESMKIVIRGAGMEYSDFVRKDLFVHPNRLSYFLNDDEERSSDIESYINMTMGPCVRVYVFLFAQLEVAPELFNIVECQMDKRFERPLRDAHYYMLCVMAYRAGLGDDEFCRKGKNLMFMQTKFIGAEPHLKNWFSLGQRIRKAQDGK